MADWPLRVLITSFLTTVGPTVGVAQAPPLPLPVGATTEWIVDGAEEIITHLIFDPESVAERLPRGLSFLTMKDLAAAGNGEARGHLEQFPSHSDWGVSFLEIVRQDVFRIDGRALELTPNGAVALWFAGVKPAQNETGAEAGRLALNLWVADAEYSEYMTAKGHYATYGDVQLTRRANGAWEGGIAVGELLVSATCIPGSEVRSLSPGGQVVYPPAGSRVNSVVRTSYAGHQEISCEEESWEISGNHPLANAVRIGGTAVQFGYQLRGGAYGPIGGR